MCILKFFKGHTCVKTIGRVMQPFSAHHLMTLYFCTSFKGFRVIERGILKFTKGHNFIKKCGRSYGTFSVHIA